MSWLWYVSRARSPGHFWRACGDCRWLDETTAQAASVDRGCGEFLFHRSGVCAGIAGSEQVLSWWVYLVVLAADPWLCVYWLWSRAGAAVAVRAGADPVTGVRCAADLPGAAGSVGAEGTDYVKPCGACQRDRGHHPPSRIKRNNGTDGRNETNGKCFG